MPITPIKFVPYETKSSIIKVYSYTDKLLVGTIENPFFEETVMFENAIQFLLLIEEMLDALYFPQKSMDLRQLTEAAESTTLFKNAKERFGGDATPLATFDLQVHFRQNASWQGHLLWQEKNTAASFRSVMELLFLFDNTLTSGN